MVALGAAASNMPRPGVRQQHREDQRPRPALTALSAQPATHGWAMTIRVGFLRAVNVGKRTVAMARLRRSARGSGYGDVWTYINSGNVVFSATGAARRPGAKLERALEAEFGFE